MGIVIKRVYLPAMKGDGYRVLIDRLWPRGLKKEAMALDQWARQLAPSTALRQWFDHQPAHWDGFQKRYAEELNELTEHWQPLAERSIKHTVTLLYAARDEVHNNAVALKAMLEKWLQTHV